MYRGHQIRKMLVTPMSVWRHIRWAAHRHVFLFRNSLHKGFPEQKLKEKTVKKQSKFECTIFFF